MEKFHSPGKLLITGEYVVLDGAVALAVPTHLGQSLVIREIDDPVVQWSSIEKDGKSWFRCNFSITDILEKSHAALGDQHKLEERVLSLLGAAAKANPKKFSTAKGWNIVTQLEFPRTWGLGSSSTLVANLAKCFAVDPFDLLQKTFGGSGYDVAIALEKHPLTYQLNDGKNKSLMTSFDPPFKDHLFFVHLNRKQDSRESIRHYKTQDKSSLGKAIAKINSVTQQIISCTSLQEFNLLLEIHEKIISQLIQLPRIKSRLFSDYPGAIKSLGGWGGDFILATGGEQEKEYFRRRGFDIVVPFSEMVLSTSTTN